MSRGAPSQHPANSLENDIKLLQSVGGPFVVKVSRREGGSRLVMLAYWENMTLDDLAGPLHKILSDYAGGGEYSLSVYKADNRVHPVHTFQVIVPGEPRVPLEFQVGAAPASNPMPTGMPNPASFGWPGSTSTQFVPPISPYTGLPAGFAPWFSQQPQLPAQPLPPQQGPWDSLIQFKMMQDTMGEQTRASRTADLEETERRERLRMSREKAEREEERLRLKAEQPPPPPPPPPLPTVSPEVEALKASVALLTRGLEDQTRRHEEEARRREKDETERRHREDEDKRRREHEEAERRHREEMEKLRADQETQRKAFEDKFEKLTETLKRPAVPGEVNFQEELRRIEERHKNDLLTTQQREEQRRAEETAQRQIEALNARLELQRQESDRKHNELMLTANKKDEPGMMTALGSIFGTTLKGQQDTSAATMGALTAMFESSRKSGELAPWMAELITKSVTGNGNRGEDMQAVAQGASQMLSVAFGALSTVMQQFQQNNQESPWIHALDSLLREAGSMGAALISRGAGGQPQMQPGMTPPRALGSPEARAERQVESEVEPAEVEPLGAVASGDSVDEAVPDSGATQVQDVTPASPSQIVATRLRQLRVAIRKKEMRPPEAALVLLEVLQFEHSYSEGKLPPPLDMIETDPAGLVEKLFGDWLRKFGDSGERYLKSLQKWFLKFVTEGPPADGDEEDGEEEGEEEHEHEHDEAVVDVAASPVEVQSAPAAPPTNGKAKEAVKVEEKKGQRRVPRAAAPVVEPDKAAVPVVAEPVVAKPIAAEPIVVEPVVVDAETDIGDQE